MIERINLKVFEDLYTPTGKTCQQSYVMRQELLQELVSNNNGNYTET